MNEIERRFTVLANDTPKGLRIHHDDPEPPVDEAARLRSELHAWASAPDCLRVFIPRLLFKIREAEQQERIAVRSHPDVCYHMGRRDALRDLLAEFRDWADKPSGPAADESED